MDSLLDSPLALRSNLIRKGVATALRIPRAMHGMGRTNDDYRRRPPVVVNSIPKSGTHLLLQVARALPETRYYGTFVAWASSLTLRKRSNPAMQHLLRRIIPGEVIGTHLHHSETIAWTLADIHAVHLLIIRDPLDVLLSEAHYLAHMNAFHRMAREFRGTNPQERLHLALNGSLRAPDLFPDFIKRLEPYLPWLDRPGVTLVRYEELRDASVRLAPVQRIVHAWYSAARPTRWDEEELIERAVNAIKPSKSHTVSRRKTDEYSGGDIQHAAETIAPLRAKLGYA